MRVVCSPADANPTHVVAAGINGNHQPRSSTGFARYSLAELCFERGSDVEAWGHLKALEGADPRGAGPTGLVAELLAERGEHQAALRWFDRAIGLLTPIRLSRSASRAAVRICSDHFGAA